VSVILYRF